jgi:membrane protein DedA with SNARE-associated domain
VGKRWILIIVFALLGLGAFFLWREHPHDFFSAQRVEEMVRVHGYRVIILLTFLGNIGIPVPEETVTILAGYAARVGWLSYKWVFLLCWIGAIIGDCGGYWIGRTGGRRAIQKYGEWVGFTEERLQYMQRYFATHGDKTVFFGRFIAGLRFFAGPLSGASHMPFLRFLTFNAMGALIWIAVITQVGYWFGPSVLAWISKTNREIAIVVVVVVIVVLLIRHFFVKPKVIPPEE